MSFLTPVYRGMHLISNCINRFIGLISFCFVVLCTGTVLLQIINRYVIVKISDYSASFTDELARFLLIWISYTAVAMCLREGSMAQVDMIYSRFGKKGKMVFYLFTRLIMGIVLYVIIRYGFWFAGKRAAYHTAMLNIPGNILYATVPIGGCLMAYEWLTELIGVLSGALEPFQAGAARGFPEHEEVTDEVQKLEAFAEELEQQAKGQKEDREGGGAP